MMFPYFPLGHPSGNHGRPRSQESLVSRGPNDFGAKDLLGEAFRVKAWQMQWMGVKIPFENGGFNWLNFQKLGFKMI